MKNTESGIKAAQYELSVRYAPGSGVERDEAKAAEWCRKAAAAQFEIGYKYYTGNHGVTRPDYAKAFE
ncbi:MAG: SEL1-like repeat protein [Lentisphaerota bacterium]